VKATVSTFNPSLQYCDAITENQISVVFKPPLDGSVKVGDVLDVDLEKWDIPQSVRNLTTGTTIQIRINRNDMHDLRLSAGHGTSRFPSAERRGGA
jgi:hypothetical protein